MAGFLPFSIASIGAAPQVAPDAAQAPQTGAEGAFAAVMAELAGKGEVAEGLPFGLAQTAAQSAAQPAGSAVQRLKLAFAASGAMPIKIDMGAFGMNAANGAGMIAPAFAAPAAEAETPVAAEELAAIAPQAGAAPETKRAADKTDGDRAQGSRPGAEAGRQPVISDIQPEQAQPAVPGKTAVEAAQPLPAAERPAGVNKKAETASAPDSVIGDTAVQPEAVVAQAPAQPVNFAQPSAKEQAAAKTAAEAGFAPTLEVGTAENGETVPAPATGARAGVAGNADDAAPEAPAPQAPAPDAGPKPRRDVEGRDVATNRHDLTGRAQTRPLTATVTQLSTEPAQAWDQPQTRTEAQTQAQTPAQPKAQAQASVSAPAEAEAATVAALAPAAGVAASAVREAAGAPAAERVTNAAPTVDAAQAAQAHKPEIAQAAAQAGIADNPAQEGFMAPFLAGLTAGTPERKAAQAGGEAAAPAMTAKLAAADTVSSLAVKPVAEPAAGIAERAAAERTQTAEADGAQPKMDAARADAAQTAQSARPAAVTPEQAANQTATAQAALPEGLQPLNAPQATAQGYGSAPTAQPAAQAHGADVVRVATPQQLPEAMGLAISRHVSAEATEFTLRLDPAELGRVEVKLEMGKDGKATVSIQADNASTFDLLRRDSHALERALAEAGLKLDSGGLNFSLRQQDGQNQQQFAGEGAQRQATGRMQEASLAAQEQDNTPRPTRRNGAAGLLDLSI